MYTEETIEHPIRFFEKVALLLAMVYELLKGGLYLLAVEYWRLFLEYIGVKDGPGCR